MIQMTTASKQDTETNSSLGPSTGKSSAQGDASRSHASLLNNKRSDPASADTWPLVNPRILQRARTESRRDWCVDTAA